MKLSTTVEPSPLRAASSSVASASERGEAFQALLDAQDNAGDGEPAEATGTPADQGEEPSDSRANVEDDAAATKVAQDTASSDTRDAQLNAAARASDEVRHAARVDLASINAAQLATPVQRGELTRPSGGPAQGSGGSPSGDARTAHDTPGIPVSPQERPAGAPTAAGGAGAVAPAREAPEASPTTTTKNNATPLPSESRDAGVSGREALSHGGKAAPASAVGQMGLVGVAATRAAVPSGVGPGSSSAVAGVGRVEGAGAAREAAKSAPQQQTLREQRVPQHSAVQQAQRGLASVLRQGGGSLTLKLAPDALGAVRVELTVSQGVASASLRAETPQARELLSANLDALRTALEDRGLRVERLSVETAGEIGARGAMDRDTGGQVPANRAEARTGDQQPGDGSPGERHEGGDPGAHSRGGGGRSAEPDRSAAEAAESDMVGDGAEAHGLIDDGSRPVGSLERDTMGTVIRLDAVA
ncbi:MAG: flagellar hook-length control protein FliK [Planctomycetota bacterium]